MGDRFVDPEGLVAEPGPVLPASVVRRWREQGFALVEGVLPAHLIEELWSLGDRSFAAAGTPEGERVTDFGGHVTFPHPASPLNAVTLHPRLLGAVAELLGVPVADLRLTQSDLWAKYGRRERRGRLDNQDQRIHVDYPNHSLVHPAPWQRPEGVELILYLDRFEEVGGATALVPREGPEDPVYRWPIVDSPGIGDLPWVNDRETAERTMAERRPASVALRKELYARERLARFRPGTVLFYRHDTWHRGTPLVPGARRLAHNLTFRRRECEWISTLHKGWAWSAYHPEQFFERLIAGASLDQRAVLGFPQPGDPYWCAETLEAVEARYGAFGMDLGPYRRSLP